MKKLILSMGVLASLGSCQASIQPLHISNITILPNGCTPGTSTVTITAAGGQPAADGLYAYQLGDEVKSARTATFADFSGRGEFLVSDGAKNITIAEISTTASNTGKISVDLVSLPLADVPGCVVVIVTDAAGTAVVIGRNVQVDEAADIDDAQKETIDIDSKERESHQDDQALAAEPEIGQIDIEVFAVSPTTSFETDIAIDGDCDAAFFTIGFPVPLSQGNALKAYLLRNYCSCVLVG